ncbi:MAG: JAB domain-containing protein, partial [Candidatus Spyradosoma sp.]
MVALARPMLYEESEGGYERESAANGSADVFAEIEAEKAKIREDAQKNGTWMKAPNGAPSKLTPEQWTTVRTKRFKRWFGDWEKAAKKRIVDEISPLDVSGNAPLTQKEIEEKFVSFGAVKNGFDGRSVVFPKETAGKILRHKGVDTSRVVADFAKLFQESVLLFSEPEIRMEGHKFHPNIKAYHNYVNKIALSENGQMREYYIRFTVREERVRDRNRVGKNEVHSSAISEISLYEKDAASEHDGQNPGEQTSAPFVDKKLADFFDSVKAENVSKVVDENGEPLVVYRGRGDDGSVVKVGSDGAHFTSDRSYAEGFEQDWRSYRGASAANTIDTYLRMESPLDMRKIIDVSEDKEDFKKRLSEAGLNLSVEMRYPYQQKEKVASVSEYIDDYWEGIDELRENPNNSFTDYIGSAARASGFDGVISWEFSTREDPIFIIFEPSQIKSATENLGTFDGGDGNILREEYVSESGEVLRFERAAVQGELWGLENGNPGTAAKGTEASGNTSGGFSGENGRGIEYSSGEEMGTRGTGREILLRRLNAGEFCHVERVLTESGRFDFTGRDRIESVEDVAFIFKKLEEAAVENSFAAIEGEDGKVRVLHLSTGSFSASLVNTEMITAVSERVNGRRIWFVHNHPGGVLTASQQDVKAYDGLRRAFGEKLQEGIIIDLNSGKFGTFGGVFEPTTRKAHREGGSGDVPLKVLEFGRQAFSPDYVPGEMSKMHNSKDVAEFVSSHRLGLRGKLSVLILNAAHEVVGNAFLRETELKASATEKIAREVVYLTTAMGGRGAILYGDFP